MPERLRVALLFGGQSAEHEVSLLSAANVHRALGGNRYEVIPIAISRDGAWRACDPAKPFPTEVPATGPLVSFQPSGGGRLMGELNEALARPVDVVVPVLHGPNGEDGVVQGALELAGAPYVGSGVLGSAVAMDKDVAKRLLRDAGLPIAPFLTSAPRSRVDYDTAVARLQSDELFVKPANMGSSVGVSRVRNRAEFDIAADFALGFDDKILIEKSVPNAREIECSVLETAAGELRASIVGEIAPAASHGFYSYDAKYIDADGAKLIIPAAISDDLQARVRDLARATFETLCCAGLARIDFLLDRNNDAHLYVNEANTLPGFTAISMYPKLWEASDLPVADLMDELIQHAIARHRRRAAQLSKARK